MSSSTSMNALFSGSNVLLGQSDGWGSCPDLIELLTSGSNSESLTPDNTNLAWLSDIESITGDNTLGKNMERFETPTYLKRHTPSTSSLPAMGSSSGTSVDMDGSRSTSSIGDRQHCEADLISALAKPDLPSLSCWVDSESSQNLGTILTASRSTLKCVTAVMSCTCTPNDNVALLFTAYSSDRWLQEPLILYGWKGIKAAINKGYQFVTRQNRALKSHRAANDDRSLRARL
ncbi:Ff.00g084680.m01.CDS01 [Fusarium sp. VM40]|nr:Ff.00g084680.m01.CDS01 [Fusarium sp. VM40]